MGKRLAFLGVICALVLRSASTSVAGDAVASATCPAVFAPVTLLEPARISWRLRIIAHHADGKQAELDAGSAIASQSALAGFLEGPGSPWMNLSRRVPEKSLYVVNESLPATAAAGIERWVRGGGRLWCSGWAGGRDEYHTPTSVGNGLLGIRSRSWQPTGDLKRLGQTIRPDDWTRPIFMRETELDWLVPPTPPAHLTGDKSTARIVCERAADAGR